MPERSKNRGQALSRRQRTWRDATNPAGPAHEQNEPEPLAAPDQAEARKGWAGHVGERAAEPRPSGAAGPGSAGETESPDLVPEHEATHPGPSDKQ